MLWRHDYYGAWLPNTLAAKSQIPGGWEVWLLHGGLYLTGWLSSYGWILALAILVWNWRRFRAETGRAGLWLLIAPLLVWSLYVVRIGGDFMEFRLFVAVTPLMTTLAAWVFVRGACARRISVARPCSSSPVLVVLATVSFVGLGWVHTKAFGRSPFAHRIETMRGLRSHLSPDSRFNWLVVGETLGGELQDAAPPVRIAVTAAGAIPYGSRLETVDMLGLSDPWIPRHGRAYTDRAGHRIIAPVSYLVEKRVHLIIAHPVAGSPEHRSGYRLADLDPYTQIYTDPENLPPGSYVVEIPLLAGSGDAAEVDEDTPTVAMIYLTKHPLIEALIADGQWIRSPLSIL
jgi:hypothetical protein